MKRLFLAHLIVHLQMFPAQQPVRNWHLICSGWSIFHFLWPRFLSDFLKHLLDPYKWLHHQPCARDRFWATEVLQGSKSDYWIHVAIFHGFMTLPWRLQEEGNCLGFRVLARHESQGFVPQHYVPFKVTYVRLKDFINNLSIYLYYKSIKR